MKMFVISDIHADIWRPRQGYWSTHLGKWLNDVDVMVIAGDTGSFGNNLISIAQVLLELPHIHIVYVMGNHDHYGTQLDYAKDVLTWADYSLDRLHVLTTLNPSWDYNDKITFIGSTLWTNFNNESPAAMNEAQRRMNDFRAILKSSNKPITANNILQEFYNTKKLIFKTLERKSDRKCVVVTHHQPFIRGAVTDTLSHAYCVDMEKEFNECTNLPVYWIHGHTHKSTWLTKEFTHGQVTFVSNQFGYPTEPSEITGYRNDCVLEVEE